MRTLILVAFLTLPMVGVAFAMWRVFPGPWTRWLKVTIWCAYFGALGGVAAWRLGRMLDIDDVARVGATVTSIVLMSLLAMFLSAPLWAVAAWVVDALTLHQSPPDPARRAFLRGAVAAMPASAALAGPVGAVSASAAPVLRAIDIESKTIPPELDGLKIMQLSDVHLGTFIDVAQVEAIVEQARSHYPDIIALTGDIADDFDLFAPALAALAKLAPPLGTFACIGNHEIVHGREEAVTALTKGGAHYLCNEGVVVTHEGARFWICGVDDPMRLTQEHTVFYEDSVGKALEACPKDVTCKIVLSHRPQGFDAALRRAATLTLSGHTHGVQMALGGRSLFEWIMPDAYLLGLYKRGESSLYTTAGLGHWLPFRFNCPCEAAILTLRAKKA